MGKRAKTFNRFTGNQDISTGQYFYYRMRFILAGDLAGAWTDFGGLAAQINLIGIVLDTSITDHAGIAITYDYRIHQLLQKLAHKRSSATDYFSILSTVQSDVKAAVMRDFEFNADMQKKEKEKEKNEKGKTKKDVGKGKGKGKGKGGKTAGEPKTTGRWGHKWAKDDWANWNAIQKEATETTKTDSAEKAKPAPAKEKKPDERKKK